MDVCNKIFSKLMAVSITVYSAAYKILMLPTDRKQDSL
jgi:hypothetical protein